MTAIAGIIRHDQGMADKGVLERMCNVLAPYGRDAQRISAMGSADTGLESELPRLLADAGIEVLTESISWKHSSSGKYVSVRIGFRADNREQYDAAHNALRAHPEVKWTI